MHILSEVMDAGVRCADTRESGQDSPGWAGMPATHGPVRIKWLREMGSRLPHCRCWSVFKQE